MKKKEIYFDFEGESTTPGPPIRPLKGHSAEWEAGAGPRIMMIIIMMDWVVMLMVRMMMVMLRMVMVMMMLQARQLCAKDKSLNIPAGRANQRRRSREKWMVRLLQCSTVWCKVGRFPNHHF